MIASTAATGAASCLEAFAPFFWRDCFAPSFWPSSDIDHLARLLGKTDLTAVAENLEPVPRRLARLGIDMGKVRKMYGRFFGNNPALLLLRLALMTLDHVYPGNEHAPFRRIHF